MYHCKLYSSYTNNNKEMLSEEASEKIQILHGFTYMTDQSSNSWEQKVEWWMPEAGGKGTGELFNGGGVSTLQCRQIGCTTMWIYLTLLNCIIKIG